MNAGPHDQNWEERLRNGLGTCPAPDFDTWCGRHPDAVAALLPSSRPGLSPVREKTISRRMVAGPLKWVAAALLVAGGLAWMQFEGGNPSPTAFANEIPGIDNVQTMTWTDTYSIRVTSEDGKRTWIQTERRLHAYRHPGQYRETMLNDKGEIIAIHITDNRAGRMLDLNVKEKKAVLKAPVIQRGERGPFAWVGDVIRERKFGDPASRVKAVSLEGQKEIDKVRANVVRARIQTEKSSLRADFLFDATSKRLAGVWMPNGDFDPDTAADRDNQAENTRSKLEPVASLSHEVVLNPRLDPSDFSLDPPAGYTLERIVKPTVTEEEMIAYLGAAARFNDGQFPDSPYEAFDHDKFSAASEKPESARTAVEQDLISIRDKIMLREIYQSPVRRFEDDQTVPKSFHYVGAGVKVGQADRIVGWYRLRTTTKYRAFYGDLSLKDATEAQLPLNVPN